MAYETAFEAQIRRALERGEFDNLPGRGKPLPGAGEPYDEDWWLKQWIKREDIAGVLPASLMLRKEAEDLMVVLSRKTSETEVRRIVGELNSRILRAQRGLIDGPPVVLNIFDLEEVVGQWRSSRSGA
jgi:DnaJ-like protein